MHLVISNGEIVRVLYGEHQGRYGTVMRVTPTTDRKSFAYTVKLRQDHTAKWASLTTRFSFDQVKRAHTL